MVLCSWCEQVVKPSPIRRYCPICASLKVAEEEEVKEYDIVVSMIPDTTSCPSNTTNFPTSSNPATDGDDAVLSDSADEALNVLINEEIRDTLC
jgi:hypothetical protein